jgi:hypothetical protein
MRVWFAAACGCAFIPSFAQTITVGPNLRVYQSGSAQNETAIAASSSVLVGAWNDYSAPSPNVVGCGLGWSLDGGASWNRLWLANPDTSTFTAQGDPAVAVGPNGELYYALIAFNYSLTYGKSGVYVYSSKDSGQTWTMSEVVYSPADAFHDKEIIAVDPANGNVYVAWMRLNSSGANQLVYSYSTNGGSSWSAAKVIIAGGQHPDLVVDKNGALFVAYALTSTSTTGLLKVAKIANPATTSPTITQATVSSYTVVGQNGKINGSGIRCFTIPCLKYHAGTGRFVVTWANGVSFGYSGILASGSTDGANWTAPKRIDTATNRDRYFPWLAFAPNGSLCAAWCDQRNDAGNVKLDVYAAISQDGGQTWLPDFAVTSQPSDPRFQFGGGFYGDYIGVAADGAGVFHVLWTDARSPKFEQEIYTASVVCVPPLKIQVSLQGYLPGPTGYPLTLELWKNGAISYTTTLLPDSAGLATINLPQGVYGFDSVSVAGPRFLRQKLPYAEGQLMSFDLVNGDCFPTNSIDLKDLNAWFGTFGLLGGLEDLNGSGVVDLQDANLIFTNFGLVGD